MVNNLIIVEASRSELKILGTAVIYMQARVLGEDRKKMEVVVIEGREDITDFKKTCKNVTKQMLPGQMSLTVGICSICSQEPTCKVSSKLGQ